MKTAFINGIILDGTKDMQPVYGKTILVDGETILDILPSGEAELSGYAVEDLKGKYIMPGFINLHVHIPGSGKPKNKPSNTKMLVKLLTSNPLTRLVIQYMYDNFSGMELMSGVTTLRSVGGVEDYDARTRDRVLSGKIKGPRIIASNMAVSVPGGHMAGSLAYEATSAEEAAKYVAMIAESGADLIKLMITGGVLDAEKKGEPGVLKMPPAYVKAACDEAHKRGLKVAAHVESPEGVRVALENGVDTIEHGAEPDDAIIELFKKRGAALVATLSPALPYALFDPAISKVSEMEQFNGQVVFDGIKNCAKKCLENDVPVGLGTDTGCPYITHYDFWREMNYLVKFCGVSPAFALYSGTLGNSRIIGLEDVTGSIEKGKCADFVVCENNPLEDLSVLRNLSAVVARGKIYRDPKVKKMPQVEVELDKFL